MSEENKNLFVELPEGATEKNQKEWQKMINTWNEHGEEPFVGRPLGLDNIQKANAYWDGMECLAKGVALFGGIYWGISKIVKHFNKKKMKDVYGCDD
jgi:hypothetical protein